MKRFFAILLCVCLALTFAACTAAPTNTEYTPEEVYRNFLSEISTQYQDVVPVNPRVETDAEGSRMLMTDIRNNCFNDISNVVITFACWDADGNFVIIKSKNNPNNTYAEFQMDTEDFSIPERSYWTADKGIHLDTSCSEIAHVKAFVVSYKEGENDRTNDLYEGWKINYLEKPLTDWMRTVDKEFDPQPKHDALQNQLSAEKVHITRCDVWKNLEEEEVFLTANIKNTADQTVTGFVIAFVAWDEKGSPVSMSTPSDDTEVLVNREYVKRGNLSDAQILSGEEWIGCENENGEVTGLQLDPEYSNIEYVDAIVVSYTTADGQTHENPHYSDWESIYSGNILENWMKRKA